MFNSILTWEQMAKQWILLNFLVRSKNYTFSETLEHYKRLSIVLNFFRTFCGFSGPKYYGMLFYGQSKYHIFQNVRYYISIEI